MKIKSNKGVVIIDPCYVLSDDAYDQLISQNGWEGGVYTVTVNGKTMEMMSHPTMNGDGYYASNKTADFPVDSGSIGIIPVELVDEKKMHEHFGDLEHIADEWGYYKEGSGDVYLTYENGTFIINLMGEDSLKIYTEKWEYED